MKRKIRIGYIGQNNSWEQLLGQIGVHWNRLTPQESIPIEEYSGLIVDRELTQSEYTAVEQYLAEKGAVIDATGQFVPGSIHTQAFSIVFPEDGDSHFGHIEQIPVYGTCQTVSSSGILNGLVWFDPSPNRNLVYLGLPVHRLWNEIKTVHKQFGSKDTAVTAERTSALQSHPYFEVILTLLRLLHNNAKIPLIHTWWNPDPGNQAATFRIDSDYGSMNPIQQISEISSRYHIPLTWFLHTEHHDEWMDTLINSIPETNEITLHCYRHSEYKTPEQFRSDIIRGIDILKRCGIAPHGYAAPYGYWSKELAETLQSFSFNYSSEFGYDYDSLPSVAPGSGILQIPVHPISIGSFSRFRAAPSQINSYFKELIQLKRFQHLPLHLYHHPNDGTPTRLKNLFEILLTKKYLWMTYSAWCHWWEERAGQTCDPLFDTLTGKLYLSSSDRSRFPVAIHHKNGFYVSATNETTLDLEELPLRPYITPELLNLAKQRKHALKLSKFRLKKDQWLTHLWRNRV